MKTAFQRMSIAFGVGILAGVAVIPTLSAGQTASTEGVQTEAVTKLSPDSVVAVLNGKEIKLSEVDAEIQRKPQLAMLQSYSGGDPKVINRIRIAAINEMINRELLLAAAKKSGVIEEREIQSSVDNLVSQYGGKEKLSPLLNNIHTNFETFVAEVGDDFRINAFIDKDVTKGVKVTDGEARKLFDSSPDKYTSREAVKVSHILIKVAADAGAQDEKAAKDKIDEIYARATAPGGDFAALAKEFSQDGAAPRGGDIGFIERGKTVPAFENAAFALKPGAVSSPVRSEFGYHIIKMGERRPAGKPDFAKSKQAVEQDALQRKKAKLVENKLNELRTSSAIKILL